MLLSTDDAERLFSQLGIVSNQPADHPRFRSKLFRRWTAPPLAIDFMAGYRVRERDTNGRAVAPDTRPVRVGDAVMLVPALAELRSMFERPKNLARIKLLDRIAPFGRLSRAASRLQNDRGR